MAVAEEVFDPTPAQANADETVPAARLTDIPAPAAVNWVPTDPVAVEVEMPVARIWPNAVVAPVAVDTLAATPAIRPT